jgi:dTDP-glucose pyrophosphorylase
MEIALLIMAAGKGSRYSSSSNGASLSKQMESVGPNGEWLWEYSVYDALLAGFKKVVVVIRKEEENFFAGKISLIRKKIPVEFTYQEIPEGRTKPWGTAEAVLCASKKIHVPFLVINADDFYGRKTFEIASDFLQHDCNEKLFGVMGYELKQTLLNSKAVSRAECVVDENGFLKSITERDFISAPEGIYFLEEEKKHFLSPETIVSMNCWALHPSFFYSAQKMFSDFKLHAGSSEEFRLPDAIQKMIQRTELNVRVMKTDAEWFGMTYSDDKKFVQEKIAALVELSDYPKILWR